MPALRSLCGGAQGRLSVTGAATHARSVGNTHAQVVAFCGVASPELLHIVMMLIPRFPTNERKSSSVFCVQPPLCVVLPSPGNKYAINGHRIRGNRWSGLTHIPRSRYRQPSSRSPVSQAVAGTLARRPPAAYPAPVLPDHRSRFCSLDTDRASSAWQQAMILGGFPAGTAAEQARVKQEPSSIEATKYWADGYRRAYRPHVDQRVCDTYQQRPIRQK